MAEVPSQSTSKKTIQMDKFKSLPFTMFSFMCVLLTYVIHIFVLTTQIGTFHIDSIDLNERNETCLNPTQHSFLDLEIKFTQ